MSASLVGSEMCIRDSLILGADAARHGCLRGCQAGGRLGQLPDQGGLVAGWPSSLRRRARSPGCGAGPHRLRAAHCSLVPA
eukprot:4673529-Alexandrium_andersonii.AAC.1